jgi:hypothetical protein
MEKLFTFHRFMSELIIKSKQNIKAAHEMISTFGFFSSSIHCSYYSCVQLLIEILINDFGIPDHEIVNEARKDGTGSHVFASNTVFSEIHKEEWKTARDFNRDIEKLRRRRENADYHEFQVSKEYSMDAFKEANNINTALVRFFKLEY